MAVKPSKQPTILTDAGIPAQGSDIYKVSINGNLKRGYIVPLEGGVTLSSNVDIQDFTVASRVRMKTYQNPHTMISISCTYTMGSPTAQSDGDTAIIASEADYNEALGVAGTANANWTWELEAGTIWIFTVDEDASDRGLQSANSLRQFSGQKLFLEPGAQVTVPKDGIWRLDLTLVRYKDSPIHNAPRRSSTSGKAN